MCSAFGVLSTVGQYEGVMSLGSSLQCVSHTGGQKDAASITDGKNWPVFELDVAPGALQQSKGKASVESLSNLPPQAMNLMAGR